MNPGNVIFLSGVSSCGKTTLAKILQQRLGKEEPYLHVPLDSFIEMLPPESLNSVPEFFRMAEGFHRSIRGLVDAGNNAIVDHVLIEPEWLEQCLHLLRDRYVLFVGLDCPLEILEERERRRDTRRQGFARSQLAKIHRGKIYDLLLDTSILSPDQCVDKVLEFYHTRQPAAFEQMRKKDRQPAEPV